MSSLKPKSGGRLSSSPISSWTSERLPNWVNSRPSRRPDESVVARKRPQWTIRLTLAHAPPAVDVHREAKAPMGDHPDPPALGLETPQSRFGLRAKRKIHAPCLNVRSDPQSGWRADVTDGPLTEVPVSSEFPQSLRTARLVDGSHAPSEQAIVLAQCAKEAEGVIEAIQFQSLLRQTKGLSPF
jgi:hypothetical protein